MNFCNDLRFREDYSDHSPSILSEAWLAIQGPRSMYMGSTWEWKSRNYLPHVSAEEVRNALQELLPKASAIYPDLKEWTFSGARAGLRAMPPLTPQGSLPLLGCINDLVGGRNHTCKYWLFGGLGSRGLLYHGWLGKLIAQAVLLGNEDLIPSELTSWRRKINWICGFVTPQVLWCWKKQVVCGTWHNMTWHVDLYRKLKEVADFTVHPLHYSFVEGPKVLGKVHRV